VRARSHRGAPGQNGRNLTSQGPSHSSQQGTRAGQRWWPGLTKCPDLRQACSEQAGQAKKSICRSGVAQSVARQGQNSGQAEDQHSQTQPKQRAKHGAELKWAPGPMAGVHAEAPAEADRGREGLFVPSGCSHCQPSINSE